MRKCSSYKGIHRSGSNMGDRTEALDCGGGTMGVTDDRALDEGNSSEGRETRTDIIRKKETEIHS